MPIDINLLRADRGGDPDLVRESQRRRFASVELVDQVRKEGREGEGTKGHTHRACERAHTTHTQLCLPVNMPAVTYVVLVLFCL